jgi:hypothetical protein
VPRRNRVTPFNTIEADPARGTLMGNRGILHDAEGRMGTRRWTHPHWIACRLAFKDYWRPIASPGAWTELFFLDEAVAFAAGHRPCAFCRRADYNRFVALWKAVHGWSEARAGSIDKALHSARLEGRPPRQRTFSAPLAGLPDGTFVTLLGETGAWLRSRDRLLHWTHAGYDRAIAAKPDSPVSVLTPAPIVAVFRAGYAPAVHPSAERP